MKTLHHPETADLSLPAVLHALSDPVRLIVAKALADRGEHSCGTFDVPVAKSTLSHHLRVLREAGVTQVREEGTSKYISLRRADVEGRFPGVLDAILDAADMKELYARAEREGEAEG